MNKRTKLPKVIVRTAVDTEGKSDTINDREDKPRSLKSNEPAAQKAPAVKTSPAPEVVGMAPEHETPPVPAASDVRPPPPKPDDIFSIRQQAIARQIVERHANFSGIGGFIPLPVVNVAGITVIILRMLKLLSAHYGVPFERDRARTIVIGLMGGFMPTGAAAITASLLYVVPGANLFSLAVSSVAASAGTRSIGHMFIEHFESGATWRDPPVVKRVE